MADFITKEIALARFTPGVSIPVVGELLQFTLVFNPGAAFSLGTGITWVFSLITIGVAVYILVMARTLRSLPWAVSLALILGGALGNLTDRIFRPPGPLHGHVVDWIQLPNWPVFNIADSCLVAGSALAVLLAFRGVNIDGTREGDAEKKGAGDGAEAGASGGRSAEAEDASGAEPDRGSTAAAGGAAEPDPPAAGGATALPAGDDTAPEEDGRR
ncbi:signal peptidase II [Nocardiopsis coralliicola]